MPTYEFKNTETGELFEKMMRNSVREEYLKENPHIQQLLSTATLIDPVRLGIRKVDQGFKDVLHKIHKGTAGSTLNKTANF
ncbi:hypothetical protein UFOVP1666_14 [uncultured Caudovirales phage]|uniref:Uncharacterized protein n=1 Tax=uncultured Caudovirales phage TaxID=2100421 RepID=A0A6J5T5U0_9CAUD|nr:hypothetical protein UFOVP867_167 [uncultured Caudovirales phage]CAB4170474.1 hypothetical protein UFOVP913_31 [uncultured Caudovirales phage]CAB4176927.1 hypothetical protein UFOVP993_84 [uncultured Caudovirales phage]CAB4222950.1 hypothetical protein UFOVP1666_14 [uncultured Caudovirales phage]